MKKLKFNIADIVGGTATVSLTLGHLFNSNYRHLSKIRQTFICGKLISNCF